jgi:hypothetical protein
VVVLEENCCWSCWRNCGDSFGGELPETWVDISREVRVETKEKHGGREMAGEHGGREWSGKHGKREWAVKHGGRE